MALIDIAHLTFCHDGSVENIFEDVSLQLDTHWKLGLVGRNGRGKTTFLRLLCGQYEYRGVISTPTDFAYFPFDVPDRTQKAFEIASGLATDSAPWQVQRELNLIGVSEEALDRPFDTLSRGEQTKVLLSALFLREDRFLLIDEPTNHLDLHARETVAHYLNTKKGFILVSHDRSFLDRCVDHILSINRANIDLQKGDFSTWWHNKELRDRFEAAENERLSREVKHMTEAARRTSSWSDAVEKTKYGSLNSGLKVDRGYIGHKSAKMMKRAKSIQARREAAVEEKSRLLQNVETADSLLLRPLDLPSDRLVEVADLSIRYGEKTVCAQVGFALHRGDRLALIGKNGCGKSSLLKLVRGDAIPHQGTIRVANRLLISYVPQDTSFLQGNLRRFASENDIDESLFKTILRKLNFSREQFDMDMRDFSDGQKKKTLIARSLCQRAHLYLWDEPLNFIDVLSRMQIESLILTGKPTMLFVEHDAAFVASVATKRLEM